MRIWSLHPIYLDTKGLVALWRETLLAKHVLEGRTKGYKNHPQLIRFKKTDAPLATINLYLAAVYTEATRRNYQFDKTKIDWSFSPTQLPVTQGQLAYEKEHLLAKLKIRASANYEFLALTAQVQTHPLFEIVEGGIESWEVI